MANVTDPLVNQLSGSDPQNLMEYITRQKIYDSRFWKEECFGLTVTDVLEKATQLQCIGVLPSHCLALTLKLLQLHPEHVLIQSAFVEQTEFKYVRALGCLYVRMTSRPVEIYNTLDPVYADYRQLRVWTAANQWDLITMDQFVHQLLSPKNNPKNCLGIALPRLPARRVLQGAGYLAEGPRPTALQDILQEHSSSSTAGNPVLNYLQHLAVHEKIPAAVEAWEKRQKSNSANDNEDYDGRKGQRGRIKDVENSERLATRDVESGEEKEASTDGKDKTKRKSKDKKERKYDNLFKKQKGDASAKSTMPKKLPAAAEDSEEYWNEQRAKLGLSKLK